MKKYTIIITALLLTLTEAAACTSFIISGRVTPDGRPMMFKNRDTSNLDNLTAIIKGEKYWFAGITAANDKGATQIWSGHNETGFAIMNTAAFNLNEKDGPIELEGVVMRRALEICETLEDFEHFLDTLSRPMRVDANFGVIDARGGCAYYETGHETYVKFDCNDKRLAPYGYMVRTNNAYTGDHSKDIGVERYLAISHIMGRSEMKGFDTAPNLLDECSRHLVNGLTGIDLHDYMPDDESKPRYMPISDYITRHDTSCAVVIQGVRKGENPLFTTSWTIVGNPYTTVAIPVWLLPCHSLPEVITYGKEGGSTLCRAGLKLKEQLFPLKRGNTERYINVAMLINKSGTGILQQLRPLEKRLVSEAEKVLDEARKAGVATNSMKEYYNKVDREVRTFYASAFNIKL